ncbi:MAG: sulfotransferase [Magnetococcales bacterium]|nr:sulfotransferase [Magnetococcales bacterium]
MHGNTETSDSTIEQETRGTKKETELPHDAAAWDTLGWTQFHAGRFEEAEKALATVCDLQPERATAWANLAFIRSQRKNVPGTSEAVRIALEIDPQEPLALNAKGLLLRLQARIDEAVAVFHQALQIDPDFHPALINLAHHFRDRGVLEQAEWFYLRALASRPGDADVHTCLAALYHQSGYHEKAVDYGRKAMELRPDSAEAANTTGVAFQACRSFRDAEHCFRQALGINPKLVEARSNLGNALLMLNQLEEARSVLERVVEDHPEFAPALANLGSVLVSQGEHAEGERLIRKALKIDSTLPDAWNNLAKASQERGDMKCAVLHYRKALKQMPGQPGILRNMVQCTRYNSLDDPDFIAVRKALADERLLPRDRAELHFALGKMLDDCQAYNKAFLQMAEGNRLVRRSITFSLERTRTQFSRIRQVFDADFFAERRRFGISDSCPLFIISLPRAGSTLLESIVSSHPSVTAGGELKVMNRVLEQSDTSPSTPGVFPDYFAHLTGAEAKRLASSIHTDYTDLLEGRDTLHVTDKMPYNFFTVGAIHLLFPNAKILHIRRNPLDTALSIYFQLFNEGNDYAYDLFEIGCYTREYQRMMEHWNSVLPGRVIDVTYETLVNNQEEETRRILHELTLPWNDACLRFHQARRDVRTASSWQVRQPIYQRSRERWRNYTSFLKPLFDSLEIDDPL